MVKFSNTIPLPSRICRGDMNIFLTPPMPSHASLHIYPNVCHVTSHHPPQPFHPTHASPCIPTHIPQCLLCNFTPPTTQHDPSSPHQPPTPPHPTHAFPHIPTYIPECLSCYFTPPTPPTPSHASLHISPNVCHVTSHHPPHPTQAHTPHPTPATHAFPCIPTLPYT